MARLSLAVTLSVGDHEATDAVIAWTLVVRGELRIALLCDLRRPGVGEAVVALARYADLNCLGAAQLPPLAARAVGIAGVRNAVQTEVDAAHLVSREGIVPVRINELERLQAKALAFVGGLNEEGDPARHLSLEAYPDATGKEILGD